MVIAVKVGKTAQEGYFPRCDWKPKCWCSLFEEIRALYFYRRSICRLSTIGQSGNHSTSQRLLPRHDQPSMTKASTEVVF